MAQIPNLIRNCNKCHRPLFPPRERGQLTIYLSTSSTKHPSERTTPAFTIPSGSKMVLVDDSDNPIVVVSRLNPDVIHMHFVLEDEDEQKTG